MSVKPRDVLFAPGLVALLVVEPIVLASFVTAMAGALLPAANLAAVFKLVTLASFVRVVRRTNSALVHVSEKRRSQE